jgi:peptidoglycan/xylan/chitin deacetylase (PgdA/CDA1 family)
MAGVIKKRRTPRDRRPRLDPRDEFDAPRFDRASLLKKAIAELTAATGTKPVGYRAPSWNFSDNTLSILRDLGFRYESSLMADDRRTS